MIEELVDSNMDSACIDMRTLANPKINRPTDANSTST